MAFKGSQRSISLTILRNSRTVDSIVTNHSPNVPGELQDYGNANHLDSSHDMNEPITQSLRPVDGGYSAWKVLIAAFIFEALLWFKQRPTRTIPEGRIHFLMLTRENPPV